MNKSMTATLTYAIVSDEKMELIAKLVRGKKVQEALEQLSFLPKRAAQILKKVVASAAANAVKNAGQKLENLVIDRVDVGQGPKIKRIRFSSRSRVSHYVKARTFVRVVLISK